MKLHALTIALITFLSLPALAATNTGTVKSLLADSKTGIVHITMDPATNTSTCIYGLAQLNSPTSAFKKLMFSSLLAAKTSGATIIIDYDVNVPSGALCSITKVTVK